MTAPLEITQYLHSGERLLWTGRPDPAVTFTSADAYMIPFSILWFAFAIFWEWMAVNRGAPIFFKLWGVPFIVVGLYITVGRFVFRRRRKLSTVYALTTERAIVAVGNRSIVEGPIKSQPISIERSRDGLHVTVAMGPTSPGFGWGGGRTGGYPLNSGTDAFGNRGYAPLAFYDVADPEGLLAALRRVTNGDGQVQR